MSKIFIHNMKPYLIMLGGLFLFEFAHADDAESEFKKHLKLAEQGDASSQHMVSCLYSEGLGVIKNPPEAFKWLSKAAEQGDASAQGSLGLSYISGDGVKENPTEGYKWLLLAEAKSDKIAKIAIPKLALTPEQRAEGQRLAKEWQEKFDKAHPD